MKIIPAGPTVGAFVQVAICVGVSPQICATFNIRLTRHWAQEKGAMASVLQIFGYIITWTAFPLGIASCLARAYCCRWVVHGWKIDDYMSIIMGVSHANEQKESSLIQCS